ncbi:MAG: hypothetical protein WCA10_17440 [Terracidiphilus sp.]
MKKNHLQASVEDFERVIEEGQRIFQSGEPLGQALAILFAMKSAYAIRACLWKWNSEQSEALETGLHSSRLAPQGLPTLSSVRTAAPKLISAESKSRAEILLLFEEAGVADLCPAPNEQLLTMELVGRRLSGQALQVPLVELALFAVETGDIAGAKKYVAEARELAPTGWESHNLYALEGLFAFRDGSVPEAVRALDKSIAVCLVDEYALLNCQVRAPNLALAQDFLEHGDATTVVTYLSQCMDVWQSLRRQIGELIGLIKGGETVDLQASEFALALSRFSYRLQMQSVQARCLQEWTGPPSLTTFRMSSYEIETARKDLAEDCERYISERVKHSIQYLDEEEPEL